MRLADTGYTKEEIMGLVEKYMIDTYERFPMIAERAKDMYIYDEKGEAYLDFYAGIAVNSAGNCNEKVVAAVKDQVEDVMHTFNYPYTIPQALLISPISTMPSSVVLLSLLVIALYSILRCSLCNYDYKIKQLLLM